MSQAVALQELGSSWHTHLFECGCERVLFPCEVYRGVCFVEAPSLMVLEWGVVSEAHSRAVTVRRHGCDGIQLPSTPQAPCSQQEECVLMTAAGLHVPQSVPRSCLLPVDAGGIRVQCGLGVLCGYLLSVL